MAAIVTFVLMMTCVVALLVGLCVFSFAMHCLLVVIQDTAAGGDEVFWAAEPFQDAIGGGFHLMAVVLIVLAPIGILTRALGQVWLPDNPALRFLLLAVPGLWLLLPIALLSSLSASSRWIVFRPIVVWNLLRLVPLTSAVYLLSAILALIVAALAYVTIVAGWLPVAPLAAVATSTAILIYGRLLGRLGGQMSYLSLGKRKPKKKSRPKANPRPTNEQAVQASDLIGPEEMDPEWETTPYGQKRRRSEGYGIVQETPAAPDEGLTTLNMPSAASITDEPASIEPTDFDRVVRKRRRSVVKSQYSLLAGVFPFPWYSRTRSRWLVLSAGFLAVYGVAYVVASLYLTVAKTWL